MRKYFDVTLVIVLLVAGALAAAILWPLPVKAEPGPPCGPRERVATPPAGPSRDGGPKPLKQQDNQSQAVSHIGLRGWIFLHVVR